MRTNTLKQKLDRGQVAFGAMIIFPESSVAEMLGFMAFDRVLTE